jgi:ubiquinone/menaquinone biosynthesis C-methylase UbiE
MFKVEDSLWWFAAMRRISNTLIDRHISKAHNRATAEVLDAGCGTGGQIPALEKYGRVTAFDFYEPAAEMCLHRRKGRIAVASIDAIPYADSSFDVVTAFDVVCQLPAPRDEQCLKELARVLKPGGTFLVRVPAFQWLYGPTDRTLHTSHRYTTSEMSAKLARAGLTPVQSTYANFFLFPVALVRRMLAKFVGQYGDTDVRPVFGPLNAALKALLSLEAPIVERTSLPFGLSCIVVAKKL